MIARRCADAVRIRHEQRIGGVGETAHAAHDGVARIRILRGECLLPDHKPCGLPRSKIAGEQCRRTEKEYWNDLHAQISIGRETVWILSLNYSKGSGHWLPAGE